MPSLLGNVGRNLMGFFAGKAAAALAGILLLRALRPEAAGVYGAALGFAALFQSLADFGLSACVTRQAGARPAQAGALLSRALVAQALQVLAAGLALGLLVRLGGAAEVDGRQVLLAYAYVALNSLASPVAAVLQGLERFSLLGVLTTTASLLNAAALGALLLWGQVDPSGALQASMAAAALAGLVWAWGARRAGLGLQWVRFSQVVRLWRDGLPFALVSVSNQIYVRVDLAMLAWMAGTGAVGFYVAAVRLVDLLVPVLGALNGPLYARLSRLQGQAGRGSARAHAQARDSLRRALRAMGALCLPLGVGGSLLAGPLMAALFGPAFLPGAAALAWLAWVPALIGIHGSLLHALNAAGRTLRLGQVFAFNVLVNVGLNLLLIPRYGIAGAAAASVACEVVNLGAAWILAGRAGLAPALGVVLWPALPAALGMGLGLHLALAAWAHSVSLAWTLGLVAAGASAYAVLLAVLGFVGEEERAVWRRLRGAA